KDLRSSDFGRKDGTYHRAEAMENPDPPQEMPERSRKPSVSGALRNIVIGKPRDPTDPRVFHHLSLIAFLAWVGLGADGLSSSAYGPAAAFEALGPHTYLAVFLTLMVAAPAFLISYVY